MGLRARSLVFALVIGLFLYSLVGFSSQVYAEQTLLSDNFTSDSALNANVWQSNGPVGTAVFSAAKTAVDAGYGGSLFTLVDPAPSFSADGMLINSVNEAFRMTTLESVNSFSAPLTLQASVMASQSGGAAFCIWLVGDSGGLCGLNGIFNPNVAYYGIWSDLNQQWWNKLAFSSPQLNTIYQLTINVTSSGEITLTVGSNGQTIGSVSEQSPGTGPFKIVLGQYNIYSRTGYGSNQAYWKSVALTSSLPSITPTPKTSTSISPSPSSSLSSPSNPPVSPTNSAQAPSSTPTESSQPSLTSSPTSTTNTRNDSVTPSSSATPFSTTNTSQSLTPSPTLFPTNSVQSTPNETPIDSILGVPSSPISLMVTVAIIATSVAAAIGFLAFRSQKKRSTFAGVEIGKDPLLVEKDSHERSVQRKAFVPTLIVAGISAGISNSILVNFATDIAKTFFGNSGPAALGAVSQLSTVNEVGVLALTLLSSFLLVKLRHKRLYQTGLLLVMISSIGGFFAPTLIFLQVFYVLEGVGSIIISLTAATLIGNALPADKKAKALGYLLAAGAATTLVMIPTLGLIVSFAGWRFCFVLLVFPMSLGAMLLSSYALPARNPEETAVRKENPYKESFKLVLKNKSAVACLIASLLTVAGGQVAVFAMAFYRTRFELPREYTLGIMEVAIGLGFIGYMLSGQIISRTGAKRLALISTAANCCLTATFFFIPNLWLAFTLDMMHVWFASMATPAFMYLGLEQIPQYRGTMVSLGSLFNTVGNMIAPALGGTLLIYATGLGYGAVGIALATMTFVACVVAFVWVKDHGYIRPKVKKQ